LPFVIREKDYEVWGVGEAIGCVAPLAGDGIVPGLKSARLLLEWWDDPEGYTRAVLREFGWMKQERAVVDKLRRGQKLGLDSAWALKRNSKRMGIKVGLREASALLRRLR
jgi:flavin-dependent dehydrogenase